MRKFAAIVFLSCAAFAQDPLRHRDPLTPSGSVPPPALIGKYTIGTPGAGQTALPAASSYSGYLATVVDCESASACSTGGGTVSAWLRSNGATWSLTGGGGSPVDAGVIAWNSGGNCTFPASSSGIAGATLTTVSGQTCTLVITGAVKYGRYSLFIANASGTAATLTLGSCNSGVFYVTGGGSGAISLSGSSARDEVSIEFDGTNCRTTLLPNQN